jgi:hypothetical protein
MLVSAVALVSAWSGLSDRAPADAGVAAGARHADAVAPERAEHPRPAAGTEPPAATATGQWTAGHWATVLAGLDRRRARAYAAGDPALLRAVYVRGSAALRRDQRLLARYARRGLRVDGLRMHVADLRVRTRRPDVVALEVRDRVAAGTVTGHGHRPLSHPLDRPLAADDLDTRLLTLRRVDRGVWLVAAVRPVS